MYHYLDYHVRMIEQHGRIFDNIFLVHLDVPVLEFYNIQYLDQLHPIIYYDNNKNRSIHFHTR